MKKIIIAFLVFACLLLIYFNLKQGEETKPIIVEGKSTKQWANLFWETEDIAEKQKVLSLFTELDPAIEDVVPVLRKGLEIAKEEGLRQRVAGALSHTHPKVPGVVPAMLQILKDGEKSTSDKRLINCAVGFFASNKIEARLAIPKLIQIIEEESQQPNPLKMVTEGHLYMAAYELGMYGKKAKTAIPTLRNAYFRVASSVVRYNILHALSNISWDHPMTQEVIQSALKEPTGEVRYQAAVLQWEKNQKDEELITSICCFLEDKGTSSQLGAVHFLGKLGARSKKAFPCLVEALKKNAEPNVRVAIIRILKKIDPDPDRLIPVFIGALKDNSAFVRVVATEELKELGARATNAIPALTTALSDPNEFVSVGSCIAIWAITGNPGNSIEIMEQFLKSESRYLRHYLVEKLGEFGSDGKAGVPILEKALEDSIGEVRSEAAVALWKVTQKVEPGLGTLVKDLNSTFPSVQYYAAKGIGEMGKAAVGARQVLIPLLKIDDPKDKFGRDFYQDVPLEAALTLYFFDNGDAQALRTFKELLNSPFNDRRLEAADRLWKLAPKTKTLVPLLYSRLEKECHQEVRFKLASAIWKNSPQFFREKKIDIEVEEF